MRCCGLTRASACTSTSSTPIPARATASTCTGCATGSTPTARGRSASARTDGRRSDEILPGQRWTYVFDATEETIGAWGFHDHVHDVGANINRGLFGGLIVRDPRAECVDHEIPMFVHQMVGSGISCQFLSPTLKPGPPPAPGDFFEFTFGTEPGICRYHCQIHGTMMSGQVVVDPAGPCTATSPPRTTSSPLRSRPLRPGGR